MSVGSCSRRWLLGPAAVLLVLAAACVTPPEPPPLPDPIITCQVLGGPISYDPPADTSGADVTITAEPGAAVSDCADNTPNLISGASISGSFLLPGFDCEVSPAGTEVGSGTGTLGWSNGRQSVFTATFFSPGTAGRFLLELEITSGLWAGATASLILQVVSSVGDCWTTPVTEAVLAATGPFVLSSPKQPLPDIVQVAAGTSHSCALTATGTVKCWGSNQYGQLGNGATPGSMSTSPVDVTGVTGAVEVTAGDFHSCALIDDGSVRCWGFGGRGELGDGTGVSSSTPVTVEGIHTATDISQGLAHTCVLLPGGSAKCWGYNLWGSLGDGSNTNRNSPVDVVGLSGATSLAAGGDVACALHGIDGAECWGRNGHGQLGDGTTAGRNTPVPVVGLSGPPSDMAIGRYHSCALIVGGTVQCWGANYSGQLGNGSNSGSISPVGSPVSPMRWPLEPAGITAARSARAAPSPVGAQMRRASSATEERRRATRPSQWSQSRTQSRSRRTVTLACPGRPTPFCAGARTSTARWATAQPWTATSP